MDRKIMDRLLREYDEMDEPEMRSLEAHLNRGGRTEHTPDEFEAGQSALNHLKAALEDLKVADQSKAGHYEDWKYYISKVQDLISSDGGEAGLEPFVASLLPSQ